MKDAINSLKAEWRWVSSERQMADGLTKLAARQDMADIMKHGMVQLVHDPEFIAAKKKSHKEIEKSWESMTGTIKKKGDSKGVKSGSKVADAIMVAMAVSTATGAKAERPRQKVWLGRRFGVRGDDVDHRLHGGDFGLLGGPPLEP